jgi:hypothetical protein
LSSEIKDARAIKYLVYYIGLISTSHKEGLVLFAVRRTQRLLRSDMKILV